MKLFLIFAFTLCLYAGHGEKHERHINKDLTYLELTQEQTEDFKKILKKYYHEIQEFREFQESINAQKKALFLQDSLDTEALSTLNRELYKKASKDETQILERMHKVLTPKQREAFVRYFEEWEVR